MIASGRPGLGRPASAGAGRCRADGPATGWAPGDEVLPFGGCATPGYARELSARGIREFCNIRTVWIGPSGSWQPLA